MSELDTILDAVVAVLTTAFPGVNIVKRNVPGLRDGETAPIINVSCSRINNQPYSGEDTEANEVDYTIIVGFIFKTGAANLPPNTTLNSYRQAARRALYRDTLVGAPNVVDVNYDPRATVDPGALGHGEEFGAMAFTFTNIEPR